jgi:hypothetical protein
MMLVVPHPLLMRRLLDVDTRECHITLRTVNLGMALLHHSAALLMRRRISGTANLSRSALKSDRIPQPSNIQPSQFSMQLTQHFILVTALASHRENV